MLHEKDVKIAGIHIASPNSGRTTLVIMTGRIGYGNLKIAAIHEHLGSSRPVFADDGLFELLRAYQPAQAFLDSPLTLPPCVACQRAVCPGVDACEDLAVATMQQLVSHHARRRKRPLNPQTQRIWDLTEHAGRELHFQEPTYSGNRAPVVVRGMTLQRRLNSLTQPITLQETSVPHALFMLSSQLGWPLRWASDYRSFDRGLACRQDCIDSLQRDGIMGFEADGESLAKAVTSIEVFSATVTVLVAWLFELGLCHQPPSEFFRTQGWVYLPQVASSWSPQSR